MKFPTRRYAIALSSAFLLLIAVVIISRVHFRAKNLIPANQAWTTKGSFAKGGAFAFTKFDEQITGRDKQEVDFFGSWSGSDSNVGELRSPDFEAPAILECYLSGYPGKLGLDLFLERTSDHARFPLTVAGNSFPAEIWREFHWWLPSSFRNQRVQVVAIDNATGFAAWMGVSTPRRFSYLALLHQQLPSNLYVLAYFVVFFALFLLPGMALTSLLVFKLPDLLRYALILIVCIGSALGYLSFYIFFVSNQAGVFFSLFVYLASTALLAYAHRALPKLIRQVAEPFTITALTALCYLCFAFLFVNPAINDAGYINGRFFSEIRPGDNLIPVFFAEKIYDRQALRPFCCGDWLTSDRPPLQTGIFLMQRPFVMQPPVPLVANVRLHYELLASGLQCLWICGVWAILVALGTPLREIRRALGLLIFSGFIFYNSVYTWPKFLAATFILFAFSIVIQVLRERQIARYSDAAVAGVCVGLGLVSHPGSVFSLITFVVICFRFRRLFPLPKVAFVLPVVLVFMLPWTAYQKFVDPPGNRLIKWHLAGSPEVDSRTAWQALRDAYTSRTAAQILYYRWTNILLLATEKPVEKFGLDDVSFQGGLGLDLAGTERTRIGQREWIWNAVGVLNFGWIAAAFCVWRRRTPQIPFSGWVILAALLNLLFWCSLEFGPNATVTTHSSYADILLLSIGLLGFILQMPRPLIVSLLALQLFNLFVVWVASPPYLFASLAGPFHTVILQWPLLIFGILFSAILLYYSAESYFGKGNRAYECSERRHV